MYKVDKRKLRMEIKALAIVIEYLEQINLLSKKHRYKAKDISNIFSGYDDRLIEAKKLYELLKIRLDCKHKIIDKAEIVSGHNGDISTTIYCNTCKFVLEYK